MKNIYNLTYGDSYWIKQYTEFNTVVATKCSIDETKLYSQEKFFNARSIGIAFLTEEDCLKSINKDLALAKIYRRAAQLDKKLTDGFRSTVIIECNIIGELEVRAISALTENLGNNTLYLDSTRVAWEIIKELEHECRLVLDVQS